MHNQPTNIDITHTRFKTVSRSIMIMTQVHPLNASLLTIAEQKQRLPSPVPSPVRKACNHCTGCCCSEQPSWTTTTGIAAPAAFISHVAHDFLGPRNRQDDLSD
jgi:hypothetical protein